MELKGLLVEGQSKNILFPIARLGNFFGNAQPPEENVLFSC